MRWRQLESFIAVCELGSISRAAERLHVAQPALGLQMRAIEDEMGVQLLDRHARGVTPTAAGRRVLEWAREAVLSVQHLKQELRSMAAGLSGAVTLGLTPSLATAFALPVLEAVQQALPNLRLRLTEAPSYVLREWVQSGRVDLALVFESSNSAGDAPDCVLTERLYFVTAVAAAHVSTLNTAPIALAEALEQPLAMSPAIDPLRQRVEEGARQIDLPLRVEYEIQSVAVILKLVRHGVACTILPAAMVADDVRQGTLAARRIEAPELLRQLRWVQGTTAAAASLHGLQALVERAMRLASTDALLADAYRFSPTVLP